MAMNLDKKLKKLEAAKMSNVEQENYNLLNPAPLNHFLASQIKFYRSVNPRISALFRQAQRTLMNGTIDYDLIIRAGRMVDVEEGEEYTFQNVINVDMRSGKEQSEFMREVDRRMG